MIKSLIFPWIEKKPKIKFYNEIPGIAESMPIIQAKEYKHLWVNRALENFSKEIKKASPLKQRFSHAARCPSIFTTQRHGWIFRTWQDISITASSQGIFWSCPSSLEMKVIDFHHESHYADYFTTWPENTVRKILKMNTGWYAKIPEGYHLLEMHLPFYDEFRFTTMTGYLPGGLGFATMNPQLLWHLKEGTTLIKAGTPISQYILVKSDHHDWSCGEIDKHELAVWQAHDSSKFLKNYNETKKFFSKK